MGVPEGTTTRDVDANTLLGNFTHIFVYTKSPFAESTTPVSLALVDNSVAIPNVQFPDLDLDKTELGGDLQWGTPVDTSHISYYRVYLAAGAAAGSSRSRLGGDLASSVTSLTLLPDLPLASY